MSRYDIVGHEYVEDIEKIRKNYGVPVKYLRIEITESSAIGGSTVMMSILDKLHVYGYIVEMDDFGSGYSSLNVLKDYQFDVIKIDMRFLSNLESNEKARTLIDCIIHMANRIDMLTLTEGVESAAQAKFLNQLGCNRLQGYLFGKPIAKNDLYQRIQNGELVVSENLLGK